jgi:tetratricopeptide (TPR) repeat protein
MSRDKTLRFIATLLFLSGIVAGCETAGHTPPESHLTVEPPPPLPIEKQEELAYNTFNEMLEMTANRPRKEVLPELVAGYETIIKESPDTYLAEESHYRLIIHYFEDPRPPQVEKAENVYRQYFERYKEPKLGYVINVTMARLYYNYAMWDRLSDFLIPFVRDFVVTGKIVNPVFLFYYSEAKFFLKDYDEAARGYRLLIREKPANMELDVARKRLQDIRELTGQNVKEQ